MWLSAERYGVSGQPSKKRPDHIIRAKKEVIWYKPFSKKEAERV